MKNTQSLLNALAAAAVFGMVPTATQAAITAEAELVLTFTLTDVIKNRSGSAVIGSGDEGPVDLVFDGLSTSGGTSVNGASTNPVGSIGSGSASETVLLNGEEVDDDTEFDGDSFGIGDSVMTTLNVFASASTPGSVFFAQAGSDVFFDTPAMEMFFFSESGEETDQYTFFFDYEASFTGSLDGTALPGTTLASADGKNVGGIGEDSEGDQYVVPATVKDENDDEILPNFDDEVLFADFFAINNDQLVEPFSDQTSGSFEIAFQAGDRYPTIAIDYNLVVNARPEIPEPASVGLLCMGALMTLGRRRSR